MDRRSLKELTGRLEALEIKKGFVKIYRLEYSWKECIIGEQEKKNIDAGNAFII